MSGQSRKFWSGKVESSALRTTSQSKTCHSLIPDRVFSHRGRVPSGPRRGCAPKGSLDGWPRCKTMFIERMAEKNNKIITSVTIPKAELSTLPRHKFFQPMSHLVKHGDVIVCATTACLRARPRTAPIRSRERQRADAQLLMTFCLEMSPARTSRDPIPSCQETRGPPACGGFRRTQHNRRKREWRENGKRNGKRVSLN